MPRKQTRRQSQGAAAWLVLAVVAVGWLLLALAKALLLVASRPIPPRPLDLAHVAGAPTAH